MGQSLVPRSSDVEKDKGMSVNWCKVLCSLQKKFEENRFSSDVFSATEDVGQVSSNLIPD